MDCDDCCPEYMAYELQMEDLELLLRIATASCTPAPQVVANESGLSWHRCRHFRPVNHRCLQRLAGVASIRHGELMTRYDTVSLGQIESFGDIRSSKEGVAMRHLWKASPLENNVLHTD